MSWSPDRPRPGYWMVRLVNGGPMVAARIWLAHTTLDPDSGEPMERSPHLAAQLGLDLVDLAAVWGLLEWCEASPATRAALAQPALSTRPPRHGRAPALTTAAMPLWQRYRAHRITPEQYEAELRWLAWARRYRPDHPDLNFRRPIDRTAAPVPRWAPQASA